MKKFTFRQIDPSPHYTMEQIHGFVKEAQAIKTKAYCPYSNFQVGCLLIDQDDNHYRGVNVENASYGLTICAERNAIVSAVTQNLKKIKLIAINLKTEKVGTPCGACRQFIGEFADKNTIIVLSNDNGDLEVTSFDDILPGSFGPADLIASANMS